MRTAATVGLKPDEFWALTFREFNLVVEGAQAQNRIQMEMAAWHAANLMNCWSKKRITPKRLLGGSDEPRFRSKAALDAEMRRRRDALELAEQEGAD